LTNGVSADDAAGMTDRPQWIGQSLRFGLVAPLVFGVDWGVLHGLGLLGIDPHVGRLVSLPCSVLVGFLLNRSFTFRADGRPSLAEFRRYLVAAALGMAVNYAGFVVALRLGLAQPAAIGAGMLAAAAVTFLRFRAIFGR
jgi:putative flippase GtrA